MFLYYKFNKLSLNGTHLKLVKLNINNNFKRIKLFKMSDEMKTGVTVIDYSERTIRPCLHSRVAFRSVAVQHVIACACEVYILALHYVRCCWLPTKLIQWKKFESVIISNGCLILVRIDSCSLHCWELQLKCICYCKAKQTSQINSHFI